MSNNQPPFNRSIFNNDSLIQNNGNSPFSDTDQHSLFNPNYNPAQRMIPQMGQMSSVGVHDINSLLSNQQNPSPYNQMAPKPPGVITQTLPPIFPHQPQIPPLHNTNPQPLQHPMAYPGAGMPQQMGPPLIQQMPMMPQNPNQYMQNPYMMDYFRRSSIQGNQMMQPPPAPQPSAALGMPPNRQPINPMMMHLLYQRQKNNASPHERPKGKGNKKFVSEDNEEEVIDDVPSSEEAEFSESSDETDYENYPDNFVPMDVTQRRTAGRESRKSVQRDEESVYVEIDEEESSNEIEIERPQEDLLEHIYMTRITEGGIEYLVRFQESPQALCNWIPEVLVNVIPNAKGHLERFRTAPFSLEDIPEGSNYLVPVAHRRDTPTSKPELLFRFSYDNTVLFYWDFTDELTEKAYFDSRIRIDAVDPPIPTVKLPEPDQFICQSKDDKSGLRPYQIDGVKWLVNCWKNHHGSILADEMGLGKTIQLLGFLNYLNKYTDFHGPFLIAVRTNTFKQWCDEIETWTDLKYLPYNSGPAQRALMRNHQFKALDIVGQPIQNTFSFNIFLVSYDVLLKDVDFLADINWEIFVVDEGHRIKNKNGKKNNAMSKLNARQRIILTGTPIQNSLEELWTLLRFVSPSYFEIEPDFLQNDLDMLDSTQILTTRDMIKPHLLRRSLQDVEHAIAPKDERVAFVTLTPVQRDLIRLTKLHKLWRLKGIQTSEEEMDASNEGIAILKICSHPFLLPEAENYYTKKLKMKRLDMLLQVSAKFQWLDHLLYVLKREGHRVLIFSQRVELLKLLNEFCLLKNYSTELLIGSMSDSDKNQAIERFSADDSETFIFLISTRAGSEGLNLTVANTAIIFDPDWNPQNDLQAQARCHRIGQTQKVDVLRLISYQSYEHEMFVRAQKKLGLWLTLLGTKTLDDISRQKASNIPIRKPPTILPNIDLTHSSLSNVLDSTSTIVRDFSLDCIASLEVPLKTREIEFIDYGDDDEKFLEQFPVSLDAGSRRAKRSRSRDLLLDGESSMKIYKLMLKYGYGEWDKISSELPEHSAEQIRRFCVCLSIFAFRAMIPTSITYLPVLVSKVLVEEPDFEFGMLLCSNKHTWAQVFPDDHDYALEVDSCKKMKDMLRSDHAFYFLSVIEMRLIAKCWCSFHLKETFQIDQLAPPVTDQDADHLRRIMEYGDFDPFNLRVQAIINRMRSDIIMAQLDDYATKFQWWTGIEFTAVMSVLKNYNYNPSDMIDFHAKTAILSKSTYQIRMFVVRLKKMLERRQKGSLLIPKDMHNMKEAPKTLQTAKGFTAWVNILVRECEDLSYREELIEMIQKKIDELEDVPETEQWGIFHTKRFLKLLLQHGVDSLRDLLIDRRFGFKRFLTQSDSDYLSGKKKRRNATTSNLPDFVFNEDELYAFLKGELDPFSITSATSSVASMSAASLMNNNVAVLGQINAATALGAVNGVGDVRGVQDADGEQNITLEDYQLDSDDEDELSVLKARKNTQYTTFSSDTFSSTEAESQSDEQEDDFRPDEE